MTLGLRFVLLLLYAGGIAYFHAYVRKHLPPHSTKPIPLCFRPWIALFRMWGPTLWFIPGLLWIGILRIPLIPHVLLSIFLPLLFYAICLFLVGFFPIDAKSPIDSAFNIGSLFTVLLILAGSLVWVALSPVSSLFAFVLFLLSLSLPPIFSIISFTSKVTRIIPHERKSLAQIKGLLSMVIGYYTTFPKSAWNIDDGEVQQLITGSPLGSGAAWLLTVPVIVAVLKTGQGISRVAGPGNELIQSMEHIYKVVDLRNQIRSTSVYAITRDGIEVKLPVSSLFRIKPGAAARQLGSPWPYRSQRDVFEALFSEEVDLTGSTPLEGRAAQPWEDLPLKIAQHALKRAVSFYSLDQLYARGGDQELDATHRLVAAELGVPSKQSYAGMLTRKVISEMVRSVVQQTLESKGFEIHGGGIGKAIEPVNREVIEQRMDGWKANWLATMTSWQAKLQAKRYADLMKVQHEAVESVMQQVIADVNEKAGQVGADFRANFIAHYLVNNLLKLARQEDVRHLLPDTAMPALEWLQDQAKEE